MDTSDKWAAAVALACRAIETADEPPPLAELAANAGLSAYHFHRVFKRVTGLTPKAYAAAHRAKRVRDALDNAETVTDALYDAGFNSSGRFYESSARVLGMTPTEFRKRGECTRIRFAVGECSLGAILVATTERGICSIALDDDPEKLVHDLEKRFARATLVAGDRDFESWVAEVVAFVERPALEFTLPLDIRGTAFQQRVWQALRDVPPGSKTTYTDIARRIGAPRAVRAVACACAANTLAVAIPCHRVVRTDGSLSGYRWGIDRKRALLAREGATQFRSR